MIKRSFLGAHTEYNANAETVTDYLSKLNRRASKLGITVRHESYEYYDAAYIGNHTIGMKPFVEITISDMLLNPHDIRATVALLHEMGHFYDWKSRGCSWQTYMQLFNDEAWTVETGAWEKAVLIARDIGFIEWDAFNLFATSALKTYERNRHDDADGFVSDILKPAQRESDPITADDYFRLPKEDDF